MMFYKKTYKSEPNNNNIKRIKSSEDLLEDLGETVDKVRRNSLKVVERVRRNSVTTLGTMRRNSLGKLPPILINQHLKELDKLHINGKIDKTD